MSTPPPVLSPAEARVLAVLVEKERTVPDTYPMSLNALMAGCNQKTSRDPVMNLSEAEVQEAVDSLRRRSLVIESSGGRVMRYSQNMKRVLGVPSESVALLTTLMLRGPQTTAELRLNAERLQRFSDASALEAFLTELAEWSAGALVLQLPRAPGARESRWVHLLCGPVDVSSLPVASEPRPSSSSGTQLELAELRERVASLESEVSTLRDRLARVCSDLGID